MLRLYFGNITRIISTLLILTSWGFIIRLFTYNNSDISWEKVFLFLFSIGLIMSICSGTRDLIGTPNGFPTSGLVFKMLCILGVLGVVIVIIALISKIFKSTIIFHYGSYILIAIIVVKTVLVEYRRIALFLNI